MKKPETIEDLRHIAFPMPDMGMMVWTRTGGKKDLRYVTNSYIFRNIYSITDGMVMFYTSGKEYMVPYYYGVRELFEGAHYEECFLLPIFSHDELPAEQEQVNTWRQVVGVVKHWQKQKNYRLFMEAQPLSYELRQKGIKIPGEGYRAYHTQRGIIDVVPFVKNTYNIKWEEKKTIGKYVTMYGIGAVSSIEMETYLLRMTEETKEKLHKLGYKRANLKHPLEGVEKFLDPAIQKRVENL